jgi:hypothetical protein
VDKKYTSWGESYHPGIHRSNDWGCPQCNWSIVSLSAPHEGIRENLIGFSVNQPIPSRRENIVGILLFECPECFEKFWFHATNDAIAVIRSSSAKWPKGA